MSEGNSRYKEIRNETNRGTKAVKYKNSYSGGWFKKSILGILIVIIAVLFINKARPDIIYRIMPSSVLRIFSGNFSNTMDFKFLDGGKVGSKEIEIGEFLKDDRVDYNYSLLLINAKNKLEDGFKADITEYEDLVSLSPGVYKNFVELRDAVSNKGLSKLHVISTFRTRNEQVEAYEEDQITTAMPGASEHEAGLAIDVYTNNYSGMKFIQSDTGRFVNKESWKYGFIIRYQNNKESITGIPFEPWHLRFVGLPHSEIMYKKDLVFEEYLDLLKKNQGKFLSTGNYLVSLQKGNKVKTPEKFKSASLSYTDSGYFIATFKVK